jgi:hypothetical protein
MATALRKPHDLGQHLGAAHDRQQLLACGHKFRIVLLDRGRDHDDLAIAEIVRRMADEDLDALGPEPLHIGVVGLVGSLHLVAQIVQHLGDTAHADAADSDEMHKADILRHLHGCEVLTERFSAP